MISGFNVGNANRTCPCCDVRIDIVAYRERLRRCKTGAHNGSPILDQIQPDQPCLFLENEAVLDDLLVTTTQSRHDEGCSNIWVARKGQLIAWRKHKSCLCKIELSSDRLHLFGGQSISIQHDSERIAAEPLISENVNRHEIQMHSLPSLPMDVGDRLYPPSSDKVYCVGRARDVRFGSKADISQCNRHVPLPLKADIRRCERNVRYGPIADILIGRFSPKEKPPDAARGFDCVRS